MSFSRWSSRRMAGFAGAASAVALASSAIVGSGSAAAAPRCLDVYCPPPVGHVFTIVLENSPFVANFGVAKVVAPYLANQLPAQGALLVNYFATGHNSLDNYIAMTSGQSPNPRTQNDCEDTSTMGDSHDPGPSYIDGHGQAIGTGCLYPAQVPSISSQFRAAGVSWKAYMEDMDAQPGVKRTTCQGPQWVDTPDPGADPRTAHSPSSYRAKHNPFVYYHAITNDLAYCDAHVVPLGAMAPTVGGAYDPVGQLRADLSSEATTPQYAFISPNQCNDGHDACLGKNPATDRLVQIDKWLRTVVPLITNSAAFQHDGLLAIIFDESEGDSRACCFELKGPNLKPYQNNGHNTPPGNGGGQTGAVLLSKFIKPGTRTLHGYNHYSLLRSVENIFSLSHIGFAAGYPGQPSPGTFGPDVYTNAG